MRIVKVEMKRVPPGASAEERAAMFEDYKARLMAANPSLLQLLVRAWRRAVNKA